MILSSNVIFFIMYELFAQDERCTVAHIYSKVFEKERKDAQNIITNFIKIALK